jgi:hypothetical protein
MTEDNVQGPSQNPRIKCIGRRDILLQKNIAEDSPQDLRVAFTTNRCQLGARQGRVGMALEVHTRQVRP